MTSLKELTREHHTNAERQEFVNVLMSGKINPKFYAIYLFNQFTKYSLLEDLIIGNIPAARDVMQRIERRHKIHEDFIELWDDPANPPELLEATHDYMQRLIEFATNDKIDKKLLLAHMYVQHMGDLSGGQMIATKVPGEGKMYKFNDDVEILKDDIRELLSGKEALLAEESKFVFESATKLFQNLMELDIEHYMESSD